MDDHSSAARLAEALKRARRHWQREIAQEPWPELPPSAPPPVFTIALSREAGTHAEQVAARLAERLGWTVYDRQIIEHIAREADVRAELIESLDERPANWLREVVEGFFQIDAPETEEYVEYLVKTLTSLAAHGECVILGRGAAMLLPPERTVSVRLVAPMNYRVAAVQERKGCSADEAREWIEKTDRERREFVRDFFHKDPVQAENYTMVLNVARQTIDDCVELIVAALERLKQRVRSSTS